MKLPFRPGPFVIGMLHLAALPGSPRAVPFPETLRRLACDTRAWLEGGVDGLMIENFGDVPFYPGAVPSHTVAHITRAAAEVRQLAPDLPLGINVLRNDGAAALGVAAAVGASMVRINVHVGAAITDQGPIVGEAWRTLRLRSSLGADDVAILADVRVKHARPWGQPGAIDDEVHDLVDRGLADAVIVSGSGTGRPVDEARLAAVAAAAGAAPVLVGSGVSASSAPALLRHARGLIVGSWCKRDGRVEAPVDPARVRQLMTAVRGAR